MRTSPHRRLPGEGGDSISPSCHGMNPRNFWLPLAAVLLSGAMVATLFPPYNHVALAWVALIPLLITLWSQKSHRVARNAFLLAWLAGTLSNGIQFDWIAIVSPLGAGILAAYLGSFWGLFGIYTATLGNPWRRALPSSASTLTIISTSLRFGFCNAAVWAGLEWLRGWLFTGFGWNPLGVAFHESLAIAQAADLLGVSGLSLMLVFFQAVLIQTGHRIFLASTDGKSRTRLDFACAAALISVLICYGVIRLRLEKISEKIDLKALLVQLNIPQDTSQVLWEPEAVHAGYEAETLDALERTQTKDAAALQHQLEHQPEGALTTLWPDWVLWPEAALSAPILRATDGSWGTWLENEETISKIRANGPFQLIYGINEMEADHTPDQQLVIREHGKAWNGLAALSPQNDLQTYHKHHLVLFGETIPFIETIPLLKSIYEQQAGIAYGGSFTAGTETTPLQIPTANGTLISAIPTICFEDSVPRLFHPFLKSNTPQVILNVTNDGWFKESAAAAQHFANAKFRTIEFRRPMLRCANSGISAAIDTTGSVAHPRTGAPQIIRNNDGNHFTRGSILTELGIPTRASFSLYAIIGDWGILSAVALSLILSWRFPSRGTTTRPNP